MKKLAYILILIAASSSAYAEMSGELYFHLTLGCGPQAYACQNSFLNRYGVAMYLDRGSYAIGPGWWNAHGFPIYTLQLLRSFGNSAYVRIGAGSSPNRYSTIFGYLGWRLDSFGLELGLWENVNIRPYIRAYPEVMAGLSLRY